MNNTILTDCPLQLTSLELAILRPTSPSEPVPQPELLRRFFLIWTLKEAYTKALGLGLGFDFKRIEYDVLNDVVRIDGVSPGDWKFVRFHIHNSVDSRDDETYVGVVAQYAGDSNIQGECKVEERSAGPWLRVLDAADLLRDALVKLQ